MDRELDFGPETVRDLPLYFFNDFTRFNFYRPDEPRRDQLAYSAIWIGYWRLDASVDAEVFLRAPDVSATVDIDGARILDLAPAEGIVRRTVHLQAGWRQLRIAVAARCCSPGGGRSIYAGYIDRDGRDRPFGSDVFVTRVTDTGRRATAASAALRRLLDAALAVVTLLVGWHAVRARSSGWHRAAIAVLTLAAVGEAWWFARPWQERLMLLGGGSDMLTYETYARDIVRNGLLMTLGAPIGRGGPFYYQPLYPYVLAFVHWAFGEGVFAVVLLQRLLVALSVALVWRITTVLFGVRAGYAALVISAIVLYARLGPWAAVLLGEIVFVPLALGWTLLLIRCLRTGSSADAGRAGAIGGLATLSRSTLLLGWPPVLTILTFAAPRQRRIHTAAIAAIAGVAVIGLATVRNWIVSREFVPITTSFAVNWYLGNTPPADLHIDGGNPAAAVREYIRRDPRRFVVNLGRKALYTLGFFGAYADGQGISSLLVCVWVAALAGVGMLFIDRSARRPEVWIPAAIGGSHFAAVVLIFPNVYGDRLILPFYAMVLPYVAVAVTALTAPARWRDRRSRSTP